MIEIEICNSKFSTDTVFLTTLAISLFYTSKKIWNTNRKLYDIDGFPMWLMPCVSLKPNR